MLSYPLFAIARDIYIKSFVNNGSCSLSKFSSKIIKFYFKGGLERWEKALVLGIRVGSLKEKSY